MRAALPLRQIVAGGHRQGWALRLVGRLVLGFVLIAACLMPAPLQADGEPDGSRSRSGKERPSKKKAQDSGQKKLNARDAAFIIVQADFSNVSVTIDGKPYPVHSEVGALVTPGKLYEVVVTDSRTNTTARYQVQLARGEARLIMAALASTAPAGGAAVARPQPQPTAQVSEPVEGEPVTGQEAGAGYLTVNATPTAQVYIDGKLVASKTPLVKHQVQPGNHTVRVYYVDEKKFSETKRAMITEGRHVNLYFQNNSR